LLNFSINFATWILQIIKNGSPPINNIGLVLF
jgi:hypothetical protein